MSEWYKEKFPLEEMCKLLGPEKPVEACRVLTASLYAAKSNIEGRTARRLFIQELAAALDRRKVLPKENYEKFLEAGYVYMEHFP